MPACVTMELVLGEESGAAISDRLPLATETAVNVLSSLLLRCAAGVSRGRLRVGIADATGASATGTITCVRASSIAGDKILIDDVIFTCVDGVASATAGQYSRDTGNTQMAASLAAAINANPASKGRWSASASTGTVTVTERLAGSGGNNTKLRKQVTTAAAHVLSGATLSGGKDPSARVTATIAITHANLAADDTVTIGSETFTAKASGASGNNEFNIGASATADGDALIAKINAHPNLLGIVSASNASGTITLTYACNPRLALHIRLSTSDATAYTVTQPATTLTFSSVLAPREYNLGAA